MKTRSTLTYGPGAAGPVLGLLVNPSTGQIAAAASPDPDLAADWRALAVCPEVDPELFHPDLSDGFGFGPAKAVCADCPVRAECLEFALDREDDTDFIGSYGVWGGLDPDERDALRAARRELEAAA